MPLFCVGKSCGIGGKCGAGREEEGRGAASLAGEGGGEPGGAGERVQLVREAAAGDIPAAGHAQAFCNAVGRGIALGDERADLGKAEREGIIAAASVA